MAARFLTAPEIREEFGPQGLNVLPNKMLGYLAGSLSQAARNEILRKREVNPARLAARVGDRRFPKCQFEYNVSDLKKYLTTQFGVDVARAIAERDRRALAHIEEGFAEVNA